MTAPPLVLTVPEVADALRCSRSNVYEQIRVGEIPVLRLGRTLRVPARWVADQISAAMTPADHYAEHTGREELAVASTASELRDPASLVCSSGAVNGTAGTSTAEPLLLAAHVDDPARGQRLPGEPDRSTP